MNSPIRIFGIAQFVALYLFKFFSPKNGLVPVLAPFFLRSSLHSKELAQSPGAQQRVKKKGGQNWTKIGPSESQVDIHT